MEEPNPADPADWDPDGYAPNGPRFLMPIYELTQAEFERLFPPGPHDPDAPIEIRRIP